MFRSNKRISSSIKRLVAGLLLFPALAFTASAQTKPLQKFEAADTLETLQAKIKNNGYSFTVAHNRVFDMAPQQKAAFFSRHKSVAPRYDAASADIGPLVAHLGKALPTEFCWTNVSGHTYIGPIRDQGGCGSCYSFGALAAAEGTYNYAMGLTDGACADFSESFIIWCLGSIPPYSSHFSGCDGADYDYYELQALVDIGVCNENVFPYTEIDPGTCAHWGDPMTQFTEWHRVPCGDIDAIKTAIMTYGVVDAAVMVDSAFQAYSGGIFENTDTACDDSPCYYKPTNHAIALIGWNDNGGDGYWILRNSWGPTWGEGGYMRIKYTSAVVACEVTYLVYATAPGPTVATGPASAITTDSACLNGTVNPRGLATTCFFEYGITTNYGTMTPATDAGTGSTAIAVSNLITGLDEGQLYHYRIVASSSDGTNYGSDVTFTTKAGYVLLTEGFDAGLGLPAGWTQRYVSGNFTRWMIRTGAPQGHPSAAHSSRYNACLYSIYSPGYASEHVTKLVTPPIDFGVYTNSGLLTFWHHMEEWTPDQDRLKIYYSTTSATGPWTLIATFTNNTTPWTERQVDLPSVNSSYYIAFEGIAKNGYGVCLDDIQVAGRTGQKPARVTDPYPPHNSTGVVVNVQLSWSESARATGYQVNFGASNVPPYIGDQVGTNYNPGPLSYGTVYYWRIDATNTYGTTLGDTWQFTTLDALVSEFSRIALLSGSVYLDITNLTIDCTARMMRTYAIESGDWTTCLVFQAGSPGTNWSEPTFASNVFYKIMTLTP